MLLIITRLTVPPFPAPFIIVMTKFLSVPERRIPSAAGGSKSTILRSSSRVQINFIEFANQMRTVETLFFFHVQCTRNIQELYTDTIGQPDIVSVCKYTNAGCAEPFKIAMPYPPRGAEIMNTNARVVTKLSLWTSKVGCTCRLDWCVA